MKTKHEGRIQTAAPAAHTKEELRTALEVHTLAQMLYGQIAVSHPWIAYGAWAPHGHLGVHEPSLGQATIPVPPAWGGPWVQPFASGPLAGWWR